MALPVFARGMPCASRGEFFRTSLGSANAPPAPQARQIVTIQNEKLAEFCATHAKWAGHAPLFTATMRQSILSCQFMAR
jgi:hypothetical protein